MINLGSICFPPWQWGCYQFQQDPQMQSPIGCWFCWSLAWSNALVVWLDNQFIINHSIGIWNSPVQSNVQQYSPYYYYHRLWPTYKFNVCPWNLRIWIWDPYSTGNRAAKTMKVSCQWNDKHFVEIPPLISDMKQWLWTADGFATVKFSSNKKIQDHTILHSWTFWLQLKLKLKLSPYTLLHTIPWEGWLLGETEIGVV